MRAKEVFKPYKIYTAKIFIKQPNYVGHVDGMVNAKNQAEARVLMKRLYNVTDNEIGHLKEYK